MNFPELVLPAGNLKKLKYAFMYGADACYFGIPSFSIRNRSTQFTITDIKMGVEYAHSLGKKIYITINTYPHNQDLIKLIPYLQKLKKTKLDAIVLSDPGVLNLVKKYLPKTKIHLSTQANTVNLEAVKFWQKQGVSRIILARELSLKEISEIKKACPKMELEVFIHGAMCIAYSGRCLLSMYLTSRDANQGECTQPCRWKYKTHFQSKEYFLEEDLRRNEFWPIEEDKKGTYIMNSRDLCLIDYIPQLIKAGVDAFKVEGRAKSIYYLSIVAKTYRGAIDKLIMQKISNRNYQELAKGFRKELETTHNRGFTTGFITGKINDSQEYKTSRPKSDWEFAGIIQKYNSKTKLAEILVHNRILPNTNLEFITPDNQFVIKAEELVTSDNIKIKAAHVGYIIKQKLPMAVPIGIVIRQKIK
jgi:putative protease